MSKQSSTWTSRAIAASALCNSHDEHSAADASVAESEVHKQSFFY